MKITTGKVLAAGGFVGMIFLLPEIALGVGLAGASIGGMWQLLDKKFLPGKPGAKAHFDEVLSEQKKLPAGERGDIMKIANQKGIEVAEDVFVQMVTVAINAVKDTNPGVEVDKLAVLTIKDSGEVLFTDLFDTDLSVDVVLAKMGEHASIYRNKKSLTYVEEASIKRWWANFIPENQGMFNCFGDMIEGSSAVKYELVGFLDWAVNESKKELMDFCEEQGYQYEGVNFDRCVQKLVY